MGRLQALDAIDLQSLAVRLGSYAWKRRLYHDDLLALSSVLLQAQASAGDSLTVPRKAFVSVMDDILRSLSYGEDRVVPRCEPWQVQGRAREVGRTPVEDRSVIDPAFVRSLLEPLMAGDRAAFRSLLGALGNELAGLGARGVDGRLPGVTSLLGHQQLKTLQRALNGILQASRATSRAPKTSALKSIVLPVGDSGSQLELPGRRPGDRGGHAGSFRLARDVCTAEGAHQTVARRSLDRCPSLGPCD